MIGSKFTVTLRIIRDQCICQASAPPILAEQLALWQIQLKFCRGLRPFLPFLPGAAGARNTSSVKLLEAMSILYCKYGERNCICHN